MWLGTVASKVIPLVLFLSPWILPVIVLLIVARVLIVLPLRTRERAQMFLDLLETGFNQGHRAEHMITGAASSRDRSLGPEFIRLAHRIRDGASLGKALGETPGLLPPPVVAMLQAGERMGDIRKVLPPCRAVLEAGSSRAMGAFHYLPVFSPGLPMLAVVQFQMLIIVPKFREIFQDLLGSQPLPVSTQLLLAYAPYSVPVTLLFCLVLVAGLSLTSERGRKVFWVVYRRLLNPLGDRCLFRLPWRHKRMQRDFSAMLAILLDAGMPEAEAVTLAAESAANGVFTKRARQVVRQLQQGVKLTEAIRALDDTGEFHWRLANATHSSTGFLRALQGWHDALEGKAFQNEQAAAQAISTALIVLNGAMACLIALAIFQPLIAVIQYETMW